MTASDFLTRLPNRAVIQLTGADALTFLQKVITKGPGNLTSDQAQYSALLTPQGKVLSDLFLFEDGDGGLFMDVPASELGMLKKRLTLYRLRSKAEIIVRDDLGVAAARGDSEDALKLIASASGPDPRNELMGLRAIVPAGGPVDEDAYQLARIDLCLPEFGLDYGASEAFSTDVNHDLMNGIDYKKGCFVGQEVASRMHRKGGVRKRTIRLQFEKLAPETGADVWAGDIKVGSVTSRVDQLALARVRVDRIATEDGQDGTLSASGQNAVWSLPDHN